MKVSVIIPTLNAERWISKQLDSLLSQTIDAEIIVINTGSTDATCSLVRARPGCVQLLDIPDKAFDHGGTRDYALRQSTGDERCLEKLLAAFSAPDIAAVYGRQIAYPDAPEYEHLTRIFNYPDQPRVWREEDIPHWGVKAYFFSNVCSAYRREAYLAVGGFDAPILSNEDMMMAAKLLHAGYALAYAPEAVVYHSHHYTLREEYWRNKRIGKMMARYRDRLTGAKADAEGLRMLRFVGSELAREGRIGELIEFGIRAAVRFAGNRVGTRKGKRSGT